MKISLKELTLHNFLSFRGTNTIKMPPEGLIAVTGAYRDNEALSNGSGKSSFLRALNYLFLISELSNSEIQNRKDDSPFYVKGVFEVDDEELIITRGAGLFKINYQGFDTLAEEAKTLLKRLILDPDIIEKLTYRKQGSEGIFIPLSSSERYQFLFQITDLEHIEQIIDKSKEIIKNKESDLLKSESDKSSLEERSIWTREQIVKINVQIQEIQHRIYATEADLIQLKEPVEEDYNINLKSLIRSINAIKEKEPRQLDYENSQLLTDIENEITNIKSSPLLSPEDIYAIKINQLHAELSTLQSEELKQLSLINSIDENVSKQTSELLKNELDLQDYLQNNQNPIDVKNQCEQALIAREKALERRGALTDDKCPECSSALNLDQSAVIKTRYDVELLTIEKVIDRYLSNREEIDSKGALIKRNTDLQSSIKDLSDKNKIFNMQLNNIMHKINHVNQQIQTCKDTTEIEINNLKDKRLGQLNLLYNQLASHKERFKNDFLVAKNKWLTDLSKLEKELDTKTQISKENYQKSLNIFLKSKGEISLKISLFKNEIDRANKNIEELNQQVDLINQSVSDIIQNIQNIKNEIQLEMEICSALGKNGFSGAYLFDILNYLTELTNNNLNSIEIMDRFSIAIDSEKILKNKNVKPDIDIRIFNSDQEVSYKTLSGGQRQAINWSVDQAIDKIITDKHDKQLNWKLLDEPFHALDLSGKESAIGLLKKNATGKLILITDHSKFLSDSLDGTIKINFENQESHFEVAES